MVGYDKRQKITKKKKENNVDCGEVEYGNKA